jgi:addiction module HigA family antidote
MTYKPPKPGYRLLNVLNDMGVNPYKLSKATGLSQTHISEIIHKDRRITAKTALRLSKVIRVVPAESLLAWQSEWDLYLLRGSEDE